MSRFIKNLIIVIALLSFNISLAESNKVILKGDQSYGDIHFKKEYPGKVFLKDKFLFEGIEERYDAHSPVVQIEEVSIIVLKKKLHITACCYDGISDAYLVDTKTGQLDSIGGTKYSSYSYLTESNDGRYAILFLPEEDDGYYLDLLDTEDSNNYFRIYYAEKNIPKNFIIDNKYQFLFEDKTGIVKGDLLDFFKREPDVNVPTNNGVINTTEAPNIPSKGDGFNPISILILPCLLALAFFVGKKLKRKN